MALKINRKKFNISIFSNRSPVLIHNCACRTSEQVFSLASEKAELKDRTARVAIALILRSECAKIQ